MARVESFDGTEIEWGQVGDGPPVILVHGITESAAAWAPVRDLLAETHRVISLDLRGHGASADADRYDLEALAMDVVSVAIAAAAEQPRIVGHSLGGTVVTGVGAVGDVHSIVNVDQSLRLGSFKAGLDPVRGMLEDPATFPSVIGDLFEVMRGPLSDAEFDRLAAQRRADQQVVLSIWELVLNSEIEEIDAIIDAALAGYADNTTAYLSLFGIDPGDDYAAWLSDRIPTADVELWAGHGHYPHLVDPDRFVARLRDFWGD